MIPGRVKPDPTPLLRPVWEYQAQGDLRGTYETYKRVLQVPWVGVVTMAYAHYRHFFALWWSSFEPVVQSAAYVGACEDLLERVEKLTSELKPPPIGERLRALGYAPRELAEIRRTIEVFSHGNFIQLPIVAAARLLLEGGGINGSKVLQPYNARHGPPEGQPLILLEPHHASKDTRRLYQDVMDTLGLPFVNTDYRALARWPSYFEIAWGDLCQAMKLAEYEKIATKMHEAVFKAASNLPNPNGLTPLKLQEAATRDAKISEVLDVTRLFTYLLPGLVTNVAFFRAQFDAG